MLRDNLLEASQITTFFNSSLTVETNCSKLLPLAKELVSSENKIENIIEDTLAMSFMYNKNNKGPSTDP